VKFLLAASADCAFDFTWLSGTRWAICPSRQGSFVLVADATGYVLEGKRNGPGC